MKVGEFQKFLRSMAEVLQASGASGVGKELSELAGALDPLKEKTLLSLRDILMRAQESGAGTGPGPKPPRTKGATDEAKVAAALTTLQQLQARSLDPTLTRQMVEATVLPLGKTMSGEELTGLATRFGIAKKQPSKPKTLTAIIERITSQRGTYTRGLE